MLFLYIKVTTTRSLERKNVYPPKVQQTHNGSSDFSHANKVTGFPLYEGISQITQNLALGVFAFRSLVVTSEE